MFMSGHLLYFYAIHFFSSLLYSISPLSAPFKDLRSMVAVSLGS